MKLSFRRGVRLQELFMLEAAGSRILIDCGMQQGRTTETQIWGFPREYRYVLVTHAHIDHSGRLPLLVKTGLTAGLSQPARHVSCLKSCFWTALIFKGRLQMERSQE